MSLRPLQPEQVERIVGHGGLLLDLRPMEDFLTAHLPGSLSLMYEAGPGLGGRARDLLPLDSRLVLLEDGITPLEDAAASFRGKGFDVAGLLPGGVDVNPEGATPTKVLEVKEVTGDLQLMNVMDPGVKTPPSFEIISIPTENLWTRASEIPHRPLGVLAGWGVRALTAVGILERLGFKEVTFVRTRPAGSTPPRAGKEVFRVGGSP